MLRKPFSRAFGTSFRRAQSGMVMLFALIILVLMTLGSLMLMRSMDTSNLVAGNMAFQQSATHSADAGIESAIAWLETNNTIAAGLDNSIASAGYTASTPAIAGNQTGEAFWNLFLPSGSCPLPMLGGVCSVAPGVPDASGNTAAFMIQRLCNGTGSSVGTDCASFNGVNSDPGVNQGNNEGAGEDQLEATGINTAVYYRITVRVAGPRNTISFVQSIVSM